MKQPLRVLQLEDEPLDAEMTQQLLSDEGIDAEIDRVDLLAEFRQALEKGGYAVILADYTLPGTDPLEALQLARQIRPEVPFIFLSGTIGEETAIESLKLGANDYVLKQRIKRLAPAVRRALHDADAEARRQHAERQLQKANEQLARANEALERAVEERTARLRESIDELESFSYSLSHDMRAPLRAIQSFSTMLLHLYGGALDEAGRDYLQQIVNAAQRLETLIEEVLNHSRMARMPITLQPVNVEKLLEQLIQENPNWQPPKAQIEIERPLHLVAAHAAFLTQCLTNLLNNAVKFVTPGQTPHVRIRTEVVHPTFAKQQRVGSRPDKEGEGATLPKVHWQSAKQQGMVRLWVEDNGIGIPQNEHQRLFRLFQRVHPNYEGTGLGLSIVRKATERMGGSVGVESEPGQGSRFWVELRRPEDVFETESVR